MEARDIRALEDEIRRISERYDRLQKIYQEQVGRRYKWKRAGTKEG